MNVFYPKEIVWIGNPVKWLTLYVLNEPPYDQEPHWIHGLTDELVAAADGEAKAATTERTYGFMVVSEVWIT